MAITLVNSVVAGADSDADGVISLALGTLAVGDSIVVGLSSLSTSVSVSSVTCTGESNLTATAAPTDFALGNGVAGRTQFFRLDNVTAAGAKTVAVNLSAGSTTAEAFAFAVRGADTGSFLDAGTDSSTNGTGTAPSINVTTSRAGGLIVGIAITSYASGDATAGGAYTPIALTNWDGNYHGEYGLDAGAAGVKAVDFSTAGSGPWAVKAVAFKAAASGSAIAAIASYHRMMGGVQ